MKRARCIERYKRFVSGNIYNYEVDGYIINVYVTNSDVQYFGAAHFFEYFTDINTERKRKLKKLK